MRGVPCVVPQAMGCLVAHGARVDVPGCRSPLARAAAVGSVAKTEFLLARGAAVNGATADDDPAAAAAAAETTDAPLPRLSPSATPVDGAPLPRLSPSATDATGATDAAPACETPLHAAAARGHTAVVRVLLLHGADTTLRDGAGRRAVDVARADIRRLLEEEEEHRHRARFLFKRAITDEEEVVVVVVGTEEEDDDDDDDDDDNDDDGDY